jgi:hypothetical protein|tara:strand:- start:463 stop:687 length:225 start_codon:yes stop_codon:yes gene_type:complete
MLVSVDVYTKDLDAGLNAYKKAMESGAHDVQLNSSHDYESKELEYFNLMFQADHTSEVHSFLDDGPFAKNYDDL